MSVPHRAIFSGLLLVFILRLRLTVLHTLALNLQTSATASQVLGLLAYGVCIYGTHVKFQYKFATCNAQIRVMDDIASHFFVLGTPWQF